MKSGKFIFSVFAVLLFVWNAGAQTADEIIDKYIKAIGGREPIQKIVSLYTEGTVDFNGMKMVVKSTTLNGKGMKQEMDVMGNSVISCFNDKGGWTINPMTGNNGAVDMPAEQYATGKDQIFIGGPLLDYVKKGYTAELAGSEGQPVTAWKVKLSAPGGQSSEYWFDASSHLVVKILQETDMQGQRVQSAIDLSDYRKTGNVYNQPHAMKVDVGGGQATITTTITRSEINVPVDPVIFEKP